MNKLQRIALLCTITLLISCDEGGGDNNALSGPGIGGSTARMTVVDNYLYAISGAQSLQLFDIQEPSSPAPWARVQVDWGIETLFPYKNYLLIGAVDGMHIMDNTDPASPQYIADFRHALARDPVVAENDVAYVTLRQLNSQAGFANQLDVIDINTITDPVLIKTVPMQSPSGLGINNNRLFICDDIAGIKHFDTTDPENLQVVETIRDVNCNDLIVRPNRLYVITDDQLLQYDISSVPAVQLSSLQVEG